MVCCRVNINLALEYFYTDGYTIAVHVYHVVIATWNLIIIR